MNNNNKFTFNNNFILWIGSLLPACLDDEDDLKWRFNVLNIKKKKRKNSELKLKEHFSSLFFNSLHFILKI